MRRPLDKQTPSSIVAAAAALFRASYSTAPFYCTVVVPPLCSVADTTASASL